MLRAAVAAKTPIGLKAKVVMAGTELVFDEIVNAIVAERIDPRVIARLVAQIGGARVLVTGTNGKTTTCRLLGSILKAAGQA